MKFRNFRGEYTGGDEGVKTSVLAQQRFSPLHTFLFTSYITCVHLHCKIKWQITSSHRSTTLNKKKILNESKLREAMLNFTYRGIAP